MMNNARPLSVSTVKLAENRVRKTIRTGMINAAPRLPSFRAPSPCHVSPIEMIVKGTPAAEIG